MTTQTQTTTGQTGALQGDGGAARRRKHAFFLDSTAVFVVVALVPILAAGFAFARFLGSDIRDVSIGAALAALYLMLVALIRRGWSRHQQAHLEQYVEELKAGYDSIVSVLCAALDLRDNVTQGHARRVSEIASVVAWQMGLRKEHLRRIEQAAILHDIGKIGVADAILSKAGPLDDSEWAEMKRHPELGHRILHEIDFLRGAAEIVYAHHERYDGKGYPHGLKGDKIPLGARIFAAVDAYNAMTTHKPYRRALPHVQAVEEIVRNSGAQFDPEVVRAFLEAERRGLLDAGTRDGDLEIGPAEARPATSSVAGD